MQEAHNSAASATSIPERPPGVSLDDAIKATDKALRDFHFGKVMGHFGMPDDSSPDYDRWLFDKAWSAAIIAHGVTACPKCHGTGANPDFPLANCSCWPDGVKEG